jgi:hypothetical protein
MLDSGFLRQLLVDNLKSLRDNQIPLELTPFCARGLLLIGGSQVGNEFEGRLHQQIEELVRSRIGSLEQDISRLQREFNHAFTTLLEHMDAAAVVPESDTGLVRILAEVGGQIGMASAESARLGSDLALLKDSVDDLGAQTSQSDVLNALVQRLSSFAPRVVLFVIKGMNALAWAARGFEDGITNNAVRGLSISTDADTILRHALNSKQTFYSSPTQQADNQAIISRLGRSVPSRVLAVPLMVRGKSAAVVYADSSDRGQEAINVEAIELLVSATGLVVELTSLRARIGETAGRSPAAPPPASPTVAEPRTPATSGVQTQQPAPPLEKPQVPRPQQSATAPSVAPTPPAYGELRQPSPTFFRPADPHPELDPKSGVVSSRQVEPPAARTSEPLKPAQQRPAPIDEEEKQHSDARRFARLLVSEIKLYNEQKVIDGRSHNDLYDRLKEDIDRSRQMYDKRVAPTVAVRFDYFYDELVNTLAEGDPTKLGSDFPGPSVRV